MTQPNDLRANLEIVKFNRQPLIIAGIVLGIGQGGFFDGIIFHQLLQWHHRKIGSLILALKRATFSLFRVWAIF